MDGILNLNKPKSWTSHDVVAYVRRLTGVRRIGHAGTLDPMATGVLLVCLGRATRIAEYLMAGRKRYRAAIRLGISTDSHDADGRVTATSPVTVNRSEVERALSVFRGSIEQVPPMVSAIKQNGQPLYKLARRGITVERAARRVEIFDLTLTDWHPPTLTVELTCSPGTYVRALARDLGQQLGCGAHLTALTRLSSGVFSLSEAIDLQQFAAVVAADERVRAKAPPDPIPASAPELSRDERERIKKFTPAWHSLVLPIDAGLKHFPKCTLGAQESRRLRSGQPLPAELVTAPRDKLCRVYLATDADRKLLALIRFDDDTQSWRPHKVFRPL